MLKQRRRLTKNWLIETKEQLMVLRRMYLALAIERGKEK